MASNTPNLGLRKPTVNDRVNIALDIAGNMDLIDTAVNGKAATGHTHSGTYVATFVVDAATYGTGVVDASAHIQSKIAAATAAGGGTVHIPAGTYSIGTVIALADKVNIVGDGMDRTILKARSGVATSVIVGFSGDTVSDLSISDLTVHGNYSVLGGTINGIQITTGARVIISRVKVYDVPGAGILLQTSTTDCLIENCVALNTGLAGNSSAHAISIHGASHRNKVRGCWITGGLAMGISLAVAAGGSTDCQLLNNYIETAPTVTGFECIGVTADCLRTTVTANICKNSQDNGISITAAFSTVTGNVIDGALNHGIAASGAHTVITGNTIRNAGQEVSGSTYGGISITTGGYCVVTGNSIFDDQGAPTMDYGIKLITSAGNNLIAGNQINGAVTGRVTGAVASDLMNDYEGATSTDYLAKFQTLGDTNPRFRIRSDGRIEWGPGNATPDINISRDPASPTFLFSATSRFLAQILASPSVPAVGQITTQPNVNTRQGIVVRGAVSQSGNLEEWQDSAGAVLSSVSENGYFITARTSAPADGELAAGEMAWWLDSTNGAARIMIKAKQADATVKTGSLALDNYQGLSFQNPTGVVAATYPRKLGNRNNAFLSSGRIGCVAVTLMAGQVVTSITFTSGSTALSAGSNQWFGLFDASRQKLALTADDTSTAWAAIAGKTLTLTAPYTVLATGTYYLGCLVVATTVPTMAGLDSVASSLPIAAPAVAGNADTGLTNPASCPSTLAAFTAVASIPYAYVS